MAVYVWLANIEYMVKFECMEQYYGSTTYELMIKYGIGRYHVMVEKDTKQWND